MRRSALIHLIRWSLAQDWLAHLAGESHGTSKERRAEEIE